MIAGSLHELVQAARCANVWPHTVHKGIVIFGWIDCSIDPTKPERFKGDRPGADNAPRKHFARQIEYDGGTGVNSEKLNNWLQLVGMAGVIGSLIFVGMQLRQTQEIAMSDAYQTRAYGSVGMNAASNSSPTLLSAEAKLWVGKQDELKPEEIVALVHDFYGRMETFENNHYQYTAGFLGEEHWQKNLLQLHCLFSHSIYQELWDANEFRSSFAALVDRILQDVRNNPSDCWEYEQGSIWDWD